MIDISFKNIIENGYNDKYGNNIKIESIRKGLSGGCSIDGRNNTVILGSNFSSGGELKLFIYGGNNTIVFGDNVTVIGRLEIKIHNDNSEIKIGNQAWFQNARINSFGNNRLSIGNNCTFGENSNVYVHQYCRVILHDDLMAAIDVVIQAGDGHTLFDVASRQNINNNMPDLRIENPFSTICIDDHVWIGRRAFILSGLGITKIGEGSVIGAQSFVKGDFPNNVIIAGDPARIIKRDIAWSRCGLTNNILDCGRFANMTIDTN